MLEMTAKEICEPSSNEIMGMTSSLPYFICTKAGMTWRRQLCAPYSTISGEDSRLSIQNRLVHCVEL